MSGKKGISVSAATYAKVKAYARQHGRTLTSVVTEACELAKPALVVVNQRTKDLAEQHAAKQGLTATRVVELAVERFVGRGL